MSSDPRKSPAPTKADDKTRSKDFSALQKFFVVCVLLCTLGGIWFFGSGQAASTIDVTLSPTSVAENLPALTPPNERDALAGYWTLDSRDLNLNAPYTAEVLDRSGSNQHGDWQNSTATTTGIGAVGQALTFTQGTGFERIAFPTFVGSYAAGPFSFASWVRMDDFPVDKNDQLFQFWEGDESPGLFFDYTDYLRFVARGVTFTKTGNSVIVTTFTPTLGTWYHLGATFDGTTGSVYVNGAIYDSDTVASGSQTAPGNFMRAGVSLTGSMDDIRFYTRVLSAEEMNNLYTFSAATYMATTPTTNPQLEQGLVGHWTFDGDQMDWSSTTAEVRDRSAQGNNGNAVSMTATVSTTAGVMGQGLKFNGSQYVTISNFPDSGTVIGESGAVATWVYTTASQLNKGIVAFEGSKPLLYFNGAGNYAAYNADDGVDPYSDAVTPSYNQWQHLAFAWNADTIKIYVDGVLTINDTSWETMFNRTTGLAVLGAYASGANPMTGRLDDVRFYNRALSAQEVKRLYELGK